MSAVLTVEQQQAILSLLSGEKPAKQSKKSKADADLSTIAKQDQKHASERDQLVIDGNKLCGVGLTLDRIAWANRVYSFCRANGADTKGGMLRIIGELQASILHAGNDLSSDTTGKTGKIRIANETLRLALVAQFVPQVKLIDWGCAMLFVRFLDKFNPVDPAIVHADKCKDIALGVSLRKAEYCNKHGFIDRKKVKEAIDAVLGKREGPAKAESAADGEDDGVTANGVTSMQAVANWLNVASPDELSKLAAVLHHVAIARIAETMVPLLK